MRVQVRYLVDDVAASVAFYTELLGFTVEQDFGAPFALLARGDLRLWLSGPGSSAARPMPDDRTPEPGGWNRFVLDVADIESEVARLLAAGVVFRSAIVRGPGGAQAVLDDPSGNAVELFQAAT
jgi:catechol 2,3-dioxygenase-like lactoylglutathione lyase family enzyme